MFEKLNNVRRLPRKSRALKIIEMDIDKIHSPEATRKRAIKAVVPETRARLAERNHKD